MLAATTLGVCGAVCGVLLLCVLCVMIWCGVVWLLFGFGMHSAAVVCVMCYDMVLCGVAIVRVWHA